VRQWAGLATKKQLDVNGHDSAILPDHSMRFASRRHYRVKPWTKYLEIYWGDHAQAYVTPVSDDEVCVVVLADTPQRAKFAETWTNWPSLAGRLVNAELAGRERGAITSMHSFANVSRGSVALVGDASGSVDAITGDGLRLAFQQGMALAQAMKVGDLSRYEKAHRRLMRRPTWMGRLMLLLGRNSSLRRRALRSLAARPELFAQFVGVHVGERKAANLLRTGVRLGWEFLAAELE
jgi:flavin-dependent dehydrogenase